MKYIIVKRQNIETAILFHDIVTHSDAVNRPWCHPISAGFCSVNNGVVEVESDKGSDSLRLQPRPQDAAIIRSTLFMMGLIDDVPSEDIARAYGFEPTVFSESLEKLRATAK